MKFHPVIIAGIVIGAAGLAGCNSAERAFGLGKVTPDEFRVVTKAPLSLPPDYSLRPPSPGEPRPQELQPENAARQALAQQRASDQRSDGEKLLAQRAGVDHADPLIRYVVDDEFGDVAHKDKSFADWVMFWRPAQPAAAPPNPLGDPNASTPIDPAAEDARVHALTGGHGVVIARQSGGKVKLPGL